MKCSLCQTVVEPGTEICPNCTANIIVDETPVAATSAKPAVSNEKAEPNEPLSTSTKIIAAVAAVLIVGVGAFFAFNRSSTPENFASPTAVFEYLKVDCTLGQPQEGTDQGTGSAYTIITCGEEYFALTLDKPETATESAKMAVAAMPDTFHMYTLANSIIVATTAVSEELVKAHPELALVK